MSINKKMKLAADLFGDIEKKATRAGFGEAIFDLGESREEVVAMCADLTGSLKLGKFVEKYPDRFFQSGVAEQNMVSMAVGLALSGKIPFATSFGAFLPMRTVDQIRISVCYNEANVKIAASHTGVTVGPDGATHQVLEDIATMRVLPNMRVIVPADANETYKATIAAAEIRGPVYLRFGRQGAPQFTTADTPFKIGKANLLRSGSDVAIIACGVMLYDGLKAAIKLAKDGIEATVINCHTIKPIDSKAIIAAATECGAIVTAEEHQVAGGLGSAVSEVVVSNAPVPVEMVGMNDSFGVSGDPLELLERFGMTSKEIIEAAKKVVSRK